MRGVVRLMGESKALRLGGRLWSRTGGDGALLCCWETLGGGGGGARREDSGLGGGVGGRGGLRRAPPGLWMDLLAWMGGRETAARVVVSGLPTKPSLRILSRLTPTTNWLPAGKHLCNIT